MPDVEPFQAAGTMDMALLAWTGVGRDAASPRTRTTRGPRAGLRCGLLGGLSPLACLVLAADAGAQVTRSPFICGHTWSFHIATASLSRSIA
jgi:hypothetical protein